MMRPTSPSIKPGDLAVALSMVTQLIITPPRQRCPHEGRRRWRWCSDPDYLACSRCWADRAGELEPGVVDQAVDTCCCCAAEAETAVMNLIQLHRNSARACLCHLCEEAVGLAMRQLGQIARSAS